ncbi:MAG: ribonuclease E/G, partial [Bacteroidales bacterium]|nr:ribonuclease E/G [Bacteroidales bacterium]
TEVCPTCKGTGRIASSLLIEESLQRELVFYLKEQNIKSFILKTNPIIHAYLTKGFSSIRRRWCRKYHCAIKVVPSTDCSLLQTIWYDKSGEQLSSFSR